ncbi:MAG: hypothetical protein VCB99_11240 [Myxococcota bacterium]
MNPWDVFTWLMSATLGGSALLIFGYFLRDLPGILGEDEQDISGDVREEEDMSDDEASPR